MRRVMAIMMIPVIAFLFCTTASSDRVRMDLTGG